MVKKSHPYKGILEYKAAIARNNMRTRQLPSSVLTRVVA
jgi:hypothetical protein